MSKAIDRSVRLLKDTKDIPKGTVGQAMFDYGTGYFYVHFSGLGSGFFKEKEEIEFIDE